MKASYFGSMGYSERHKYPGVWPMPPAFQDPETSQQSYQTGMAECELAEELGFDWISLSEHHYSGTRVTPNPALMAAAVAERCKRARIALLGQLLPLHNPIRAAEEIGMLDNLTGGRVVMAFMRGTVTEDQVYGVDPAEGRDRLAEGMDLVLKALTEPQPFSWEGRYYQFRTVSVWPRPVQQPMPPALAATRSPETVRFAATRRMGLAVSYDRVDHVAEVTRQYREWCNEAGWDPSPDQVLYRGSICIGETDREAEKLLECLPSAGSGRGMSMGRSVDRAVAAARAGSSFDLRSQVSASGPVDPVRDARGLMSFIGGPDTVAQQLKEFHDQCGVGVVDLGFQQPGISHQQVMQELELFGREVLPQMREF